MSIKDFWGPPIWTSIHILSLFVTNAESARIYEEFLWVLTRLLPCDYCRANLVKKLREFDPDSYLSQINPDIAFFYSYVIHDLANQHITEHTDQIKESPPFNQVFQEYRSKLSQEGDKFWGPPVWSMIHIFAASFRSCDSVYYKRFLQTLTKLLPSQESREILSQFLIRYPVDQYLISNDELFYYTYTLHDAVNTSLSKTSPNFINVKTFYFSSLGEICNDCN